MGGVRSEYLVWKFKEVDGTERQVKSAAISDSWIVEVANGRRMDIVPVIVGGTETTYYRDKFWCSNSAGRVVCRSSSNANTYAGVSYASSNYDPSTTFTNFGSRLAFIGIIVYTLNVAAFKEAEAIG